MDEFLQKLLSDIAGVDIFAAPMRGTPIPDFVAERVSLKTKDGGLGFRRLSQRYLLLNSLNNTMPQAIDRIDEEGNFHPGLWNSLSDVLGRGSFDAANKERCWGFFHISGSSFGQDHLRSIQRVQERYKDVLFLSGKDAADEVDSVLSVPPEGFGFRVNKLHKTMQDKLRSLDAEAMRLLAKDEISGDDQRRCAFEAASGNKFANAFPLALAPEANTRFSRFEFTVAIARKLGLPIPLLLPYVGTSIRAEGGSPRVQVDPFGNGITAATGVKGGHVTQMHNAIVNASMTAVKSSGVPAKGTHNFDTCNGVFGKCLRHDQLLSDSDEKKLQKTLQKIIPDGLLNASNTHAKEPYVHPVNPIFGKAHLVEVKSFTGKEPGAPDVRARNVQRETINRAKKLDTTYPGSTFEQTLRSYGNDGQYLVLVAGPFSNLSKDFGVLTDFLARIRAVRLLNQWETSVGQALALNRQFLVHKFGHLVSLLWARLILGRFYDAVTRIPFDSVSGASNYSESDDPLNLLNLNRGGYRGRNIPGA